MNTPGPNSRGCGGRAVGGVLRGISNRFGSASGGQSLYAPAPEPAMSSIEHKSQMFRSIMGNPMKHRHIPYIVAVAALEACTPGYSIDTISQSAAAIVLEYTHSVGGELQAAIKTADSRCQQYGKHARMNGQPTRLNADRSVATFDCVP